MQPILGYPRASEDTSSPPKPPQSQLPSPPLLSGCPRIEEVQNVCFTTEYLVVAESQDKVSRRVIPWTGLFQLALHNQEILSHFCQVVRAADNFGARTTLLNALQAHSIPGFKSLPPMPDPQIQQQHHQQATKIDYFPYYQPTPPNNSYNLDPPLFSNNAGLTSSFGSSSSSNSMPAAVSEELALWSAHRSSFESSSSSAESPFSNAMPDTPITPGYKSESDFYSPASLSDAHLFSSGNISELSKSLVTYTALASIIDDAVLAEGITNKTTLEFVWIHAESTLYPIDNIRVRDLLATSSSLVGDVKLVWPPGTTLLTKEKDGMVASPGYTPMHPNSNEWLKAQVCHKMCAFRHGTASLKRPKTIREHFQKCVWLDTGHPLKALSSLQLGVLERESQGFLPKSKRGRASVTPGSSRSSPYKNPSSRHDAAAITSLLRSSINGKNNVPSMTSPASTTMSNDAEIFKSPQTTPYASRPSQNQGVAPTVMPISHYYNSSASNSAQSSPENQNLRYAGALGIYTEVPNTSASQMSRTMPFSIAQQQS